MISDNCILPMIAPLNSAPTLDTMAHQPKALESFVTFVLIIGITVGGGAAVGLIVGGFTGDPW